MNPQTNTELSQTTAQAPMPPQPAPSSTMEEIAASLPAGAETKSARKNMPDKVFGKFLILEGWSHWFFRLGFASIFLVNAVYAAIEPESFTDLLDANQIARLIGHAGLMVKFAMVNDLLLSILIVGGWRKRMVYAWAGAWLLMVAGLKLMNLFA